jgi:hypothetical protein
MALESLLQLADAVAAALFRATPRRQENKEKENKDAGACVGVGDVVKYKTDESCQDTDEGTQLRALLVQMHKYWRSCGSSTKLTSHAKTLTKV